MQALIRHLAVSDVPYSLFMHYFAELKLYTYLFVHVFMCLLIYPVSCLVDVSLPLLDDTL